jgi:hypothetical protein
MDSTPTEPTDLSDLLDRLRERREITDRQQWAFELYREGMTQEEIAGYMFVDQPTVCKYVAHVKSVLRDTDYDTETGAARIGVDVKDGHDVWFMPDTTVQGAIRLRKRRNWQKWHEAQRKGE